MLFFHEWGHVIAAHKRGSEVLSVKLYPIFGLTQFETPWSRFDHCVIAWGGVLAQMVVALPLVAWVAVFGYTRFDAINAVLAILGFFSLGIVVFNLLPFPPLDGATAWGIVPAAIQRGRANRNPRPSLSGKYDALIVFRNGGICAVANLADLIPLEIDELDNGVGKPRFLSFSCFQFVEDRFRKILRFNTVWPVDARNERNEVAVSGELRR